MSFYDEVATGGMSACGSVLMDFFGKLRCMCA